MHHNESRNPPSLPEKPPLGVRPAWIAAWQRIGELAEGICRQYESPERKTELVEKWAFEIMQQCHVIEGQKKWDK